MKAVLTFTVLASTYLASTFANVQTQPAYYYVLPPAAYPYSHTELALTQPSDSCHCAITTATKILTVTVTSDNAEAQIVTQTVTQPVTATITEVQNNTETLTITTTTTDTVTDCPATNTSVGGEHTISNPAPAYSAAYPVIQVTNYPIIRFTSSPPPSYPPGVKGEYVEVPLTNPASTVTIVPYSSTSVPVVGYSGGSGYTVSASVLGDLTLFASCSSETAVASVGGSRTTSSDYFQYGGPNVGYYNGEVLDSNQKGDPTAFEVLLYHTTPTC
ncbi:hypothetical protein EV182_006148 [Spiromyces aspiralis]|uniref:Uncharacterized protein n=1 Tax=Spiromyces aspiralis TaxID=68401 RepID=A0ACC1H9A9_9FUNG|nr:hypothetical protein EV182_006148 [Spiromyces aspiralis]